MSTNRSLATLHTATTNAADINKTKT